MYGSVATRTRSAWFRDVSGRALARRVLDLGLTVVVLVALAPVLFLIAVAIKIDSPGPVLFRCPRVGYKGRSFDMLKFRKMLDGAHGAPLTSSDDARFTRVGRFLASAKLDELPQLWNVLKGEMTYVGPRPEDAVFVQLYEAQYREILEVRPGITGLSQLAFARESVLLARPDSLSYYSERLLPLKVSIDQLYAGRKSLHLDLQIVFWTVVAVFGRADVAVHRETAALSRRQARSAEGSAPSRLGTEVAPVTQGLEG
jgi:lipopolysaccharide/colanic/teichoic acid biosynthesis glycosyltransferase